MATAAVDNGYKIDPNSMGKVVIVNNNKFNPPLSNRPGSTKDVESLKYLFFKIGYKKYDIIVYEDRTVSQLQKIFKDVSKNLVKPEHSTFVLCLMSHGFKNNRICDKNGDFLHLWHNILTEFCDKNCQNLAGIPKLVITQFCQGESELSPVVMSRDSGARQVKPKTTVPEWADLLLLKASPPYHESLRDDKDGSIFIQTFCKVCEEYYTQKSLTGIMTIVVNQVASREDLYVRDDCNAKKKTKALPTSWNSLRKKFYLFDKQESDEDSSSTESSDSSSMDFSSDNSDFTSDSSDS